MPEFSKEEVERLLQKYKSKVAAEMQTQQVVASPGTKDNSPDSVSAGVIRTREYSEFKAEYMPKHMSIYEKLCNGFEKILKIAPDKKKTSALQESIDICHLNITPTGVYTFSLLGPLIIAMLGFFISFILTGGFFFPLFFMITGVVLIGPLGSWPHFLANSWRMKASNQMVLSVFYVVTYMRHTSNLELAIDFSAEHLAPPLSLDLKRVVWNIETEKFENIKESLEAYLDTWKKWNMEFVESFHLIEGSLYEGSEERRLTMLDKSLTVILDETYEKMLHYAHNLKSPITMLHMLGIILPILGLVILPLVVSFMEGVSWYHIATLYNVILPASVYYLGKKILSSRPTGYGDSDASEYNPEVAKYKNVIVKVGNSEMKINPIYIAIIVGLFFGLIALSPIIIHLLNPGWDIMLAQEGGIFPITGYTNDNAKFYLLEYKPAQKNPDLIIGPFGLGAAILSLAMPVAVGYSVGIYYKLRSKNVIKIREESKKLEDEFASALFQLGNRLGDGLPAEIAFARVAETMQDSVSGRFFKAVENNITRLGMSVEQAVFDPKIGALIQFPSKMIETSMKVLIESAKKGPLVAAEALVNVSRYIKEMHSVNERLKDLLADVIGSMKSQISFLTPVISGIVIGITSMVSTILGKLSGQLQKISAQGTGDAGGFTGGGLTSLFGDGVPTYFFQIVVGLYVVQLTYILTIIANGIENGSDKLNERYLIGKNMTRSTLLYAVITLIIMILFNMIAGTILVKGVGG